METIREWPPPLESADDVRRILLEIYGEELPRDAGVLHIASAQEASSGELFTLRIDEDAPRSGVDFFLLSVARARADAIIVTGKVLRDEPRLQYALPGGEGGALASYRREHLGRRDPPLLVVLTSGRGLDPHHPALRGWPRPLVCAPRGAHVELRSRLPPVVELWGGDAPDIRSLVEYLRGARGCRTVSIEAGPSTSRALYAEPVCVDEMMLSLYEGDPLPPSARGNELPNLPALKALLPRMSTPHRVEEPSGPWSFRLLRRRRARGSEGGDCLGGAKTSS